MIQVNDIQKVPFVNGGPGGGVIQLALSQPGGQLMPITVLRAPLIFRLRQSCMLMPFLGPKFFCLKRLMYLPNKNFRNSHKLKLEGSRKFTGPSSKSLNPRPLKVPIPPWSRFTGNKTILKVRIPT